MTENEIKQKNAELALRRQTETERRAATQLPAVNKILQNVEILPEEEYQRRVKVLQEGRHRQKCAELFARSRVPDRQRLRMEAKSLDKSGPWEAENQRIKAKLGKGALFGLIGKKGAGKTQLGCCAILATCKSAKSALYITTGQLFARFKESFSKDGAQSERELLQMFTRYQLLVVDEISQKGAGIWNDQIFYEIVDGRYRQMRDTILIAAMDKRTFSATVGESILSRMNETGGVIECNWKSFRE